MPMAARSPAPPPPTMSTSCVGATNRPWLFCREHLVHHDVAVVANDLLAHTPVVVLVADGSAAARVVQLQREQRLLVAVLVRLAINDPSTWCVLLREAGFRG